MTPALPQPKKKLIEAFERFIAKPVYPCVGAKSALGKDQITYLTARDIRSSWNDLPITKGLAAFAREYKRTQQMFRSFVVIFEGPHHMTEVAFEKALWERIQSLHEKDRWMGYPYDERVSPDPHSNDFSLSFGGEAYFVVGLHPRASRKARRFRYPAMVFNLHDQFERLRAEGRYQKMRSTILKRDESWTGSVNPMLAEHGSISEARQYSGREVGEEWRCPFQPKVREAA